MLFERLARVFGLHDMDDVARSDVPSDPVREPDADNAVLPQNIGFDGKPIDMRRSEDFEPSGETHPFHEAPETWAGGGGGNYG